jgi:hypothetical protein
MGLSHPFERILVLSKLLQGNELFRNGDVDQ